MKTPNGWWMSWQIAPVELDYFAGPIIFIDIQILLAYFQPKFFQMSVQIFNSSVTQTVWIF